MKNKLISNHLLGYAIAPLLISCNSGSTNNNTLNGYIYLITGTNTIQQCQVINNSVATGTCRNMSGSFVSPSAIAFNTAKTVGYIANKENDTLSICTLNSDKSFGDCNPANVTLNKPTSIAIIDNSIYVANNKAISQCTIESNGNLTNCKGNPIASNLKSITANGSNVLYGLNDNGTIYYYDLPTFNSNKISYTESGSSNQLNYNNTNNSLYIAAKNGALGLGGGIYNCNINNDNTTSCITSFTTLSIVLPLPYPASIYALTTSGNMAYFIDYAYDYSSNSTATFINSCSVAADGEFNSCSASKLSNNNLYDNGALALTYLSIQ